MKIFWLTAAMSIGAFLSIRSQTINGKFLIIGDNDTSYTIKLQISVNQNTALLGNSVIRFSYDTSAFFFPPNPKANIDYKFYNLSNTKYYYSISHPSSNIISINVALISDTGATVTSNFLDLASIRFKKIIQSDNAKIQPTLLQFFSPLSSQLWNIGNWKYSSITPILSQASILDSTTVELSFSEQVDSISAADIINYTINNNISVKSAVISPDFTKVTLKTSVYSSNKTYLVTVQNLKDVFGNPILSGNNTFQYSYYGVNIPLNVTGVIVNNNHTVTIQFNKKLDPVSAVKEDNYSLSNNLAISQTSLMPDSETVSLKTLKLQNNIDYSLTIKNVKDQTGNLISPNPVVETIALPLKGNGIQKQNKFVQAVSSAWVQNFSPENVIDTQETNIEGSRWISATPMPDTLSLDMGKIDPLNSIRLSFYKWETGALYKYSIYSSTGTNSWNPLVQNVWSDSSEWSEVDFDSTKSRFIKIILLQSNQTEYASIWKVEAYGTYFEPAYISSFSIPKSFEISQNYPNPFNPSTKINYSIAKSCDVQLTIYDILGKKIKELVNSYKETGNYTVEFNANNLSSGIYFYHLQAGNFTETKKMMLMK